MSGRMVTALVFIALLSVFAANISVGCGGAQYVYGPVDQKMRKGGGGEGGSYAIRVQGQFYEVPPEFFGRVAVGDTVKFDGREWTIVKRSPTTLGSPKPSPSPSP